jgi:hypothetical protein
MYAHDAVLEMSPDGDLRAPGAAITVALCGAWDHEPPCPLAPHHTDAERDGSEVRLRVLFATEPPFEEEVRRRIDGALEAGSLDQGSGSTAHWHTVWSGPADVREGELGRARRLART